jgi:phosphatidylglycerophosphatase A
MTSSAELSDRKPPLHLDFGDRIVYFVATWFFSGLLPKAPGTWGTLAAIPLIVPLIIFLNPWQYLLAVIIITILSIPFAGRLSRLAQTNPAVAARNPHRAEAIADSEMIKGLVKDADGQHKDPGMIVIDEVAGFAAAMLFLPPNPVSVILAFFFFRVFDILKVEPGRLLERLPGGIGIVLDDTSAGLYACLACHIAYFTARLMMGQPLVP